MKKMWKALAVLTALALFGSAFTACKSDDDDGDGNNGGGGSTVVSVAGVSLDKESAELEVGGTLALKATVAPDDAANKNVSWKSDKEEVATVANGTVTAVAAGSAVITVTTEDGGKTASCTITVTEKSSEDDDTGDINVEIKF